MNRAEILAAVGERPSPGPELAQRVAGGPDMGAFFASGRRSLEEVRNALATVNRDLDDYRTILDFGAGCGRMLTWLEPLARAGTQLHGTDTDAELVAWLSENLDFVTAQVNDPLPPMPYADGQFDLVYNHSVFTHLDELRQNAWLTELQRITRVGGHVVLTVHGEGAFAQYEDAMMDVGGDARQERLTLHRDGFVFMPDESWQAQGFPAWYGGTYHATNYIFHHWSRWFRIRAYLPQGALNFQDMVVLERAADGHHHGAYLRQPPLTVAAPPPGSDDRCAELELARAQELIDRGPDLRSRSCLGPAGSAWRRVLARLMANYAAHERDVDEALLAAMRSTRTQPHHDQDQ